MPFTKETAKVYGAKGLKAKKEHRDDWWAFVASGGLRRYRELYMQLGEGEMINEAQQLFMEKTEKSFPFIKARKTDITTDGKELPQPILGGIITNEVSKHDSSDEDSQTEEEA